MFSSGDTISAIATAPGRGGVAVIRVSGPDAFAVAKTLTGRFPTPGRVVHVRLAVDDCILLAFKAPHSYTGEDVVEFQCHGGTVTPRRVLELTFGAGARIAERGEFTARAFVNGKLPLEAVEGVINLIDAKTSRAADSALAQMHGEGAAGCRSLYENALAISADLEHALDIDEGELPNGYVESLMAKIKGLKDEIERTIARLREGKILREGALVVLAGSPNAGKSSLLNALLGESRAIVSDVPGTTRDSIEEYVDMGGWPIRLADTAGIRRTDDVIEQAGVDRSKALIAAADVVIALDCELPGALKVHAKCDLGRDDAVPINVSAKTGEGLDDLRRAIVERLEKMAMDISEPSSDHTISILLSALSQLEDNFPPRDIVIVANRIRYVAEKLGLLCKAVYSDDLLTSIFSRFCVGK